MTTRTTAICDACDRQQLELVGVDGQLGGKQWLRSCKFTDSAATAYLLELEAHRTGRCPFYLVRDPPQPDSYIAADTFPVITFKDLLSP